MLLSSILNARRMVALVCLGAAVVPLFIAACDSYQPPSSQDYPLQDLSIACAVASNGEQMLITANAAVIEEGSDFPSSVSLDGGDRLTASAEGASAKVLTPLFGESGLAVGTLLSTSASEVELELSRGGESVSGTLELPPPFTLEAGSNTLTYPIQLTWEPDDGTDTMSISIFGDCMGSPFTRQLMRDTGSYEISSIDLGNAGCALLVSVSRTRAATFDVIGHGSACSSVQTRTILLEEEQQ